MNVIITGASRGIGKATAEIFAANGHDLYLSSRNEKALYKTMEELVTKFPNITVKSKPFDLSKKENAIALGKWIVSLNISIDVLSRRIRKLNNAQLNCALCPKKDIEKSPVFVEHVYLIRNSYN